MRKTDFSACCEVEDEVAQLQGAALKRALKCTQLQLPAEVSATRYHLWVKFCGAMWFYSIFLSVSEEANTTTRLRIQK